MLSGIVANIAPRVDTTSNIAALVDTTSNIAPRVDILSNIAALVDTTSNIAAIVGVPELGQVGTEFVSQELSKSDRPELTAAKTVISGGHLLLLYS